MLYLSFLSSSNPWMVQMAWIEQSAKKPWMTATFLKRGKFYIWEIRLWSLFRSTYSQNICNFTFQFSLSGGFTLSCSDLQSTKWSLLRRLTCWLWCPGLAAEWDKCQKLGRVKLTKVSFAQKCTHFAEQTLKMDSLCSWGAWQYKPKWQ